MLLFPTGVPKGEGPGLVGAELVRGTVLSPVAAVVLGAPPRNRSGGHPKQGQVNELHDEAPWMLCISSLDVPCKGGWMVHGGTRWLQP